MEVVVRRAQRDDMPHVLQLIKELADFENVPEGPELTLADLERDGFDSDQKYFFCILVEDPSNNNAIIGQAFCNFAYSTWVGRAMYLEDFYVKPEFRGRKIGHKLFKEVCKIAQENRCNRIDWHTLVDNDLAIKFYESHGAVDVCKEESRTCYRIHEHEINAVANCVD